MPNPSATSAENVNSELGRTATASGLELNWANVRNIACKTSGDISYGDCRWGINFPGGTLSDNFDYAPNYDATSQLFLAASDFVDPYGPSDDVQGFTGLYLYSNGVMRLEAGTTAALARSYHRTWLTSGSNTDYTARVDLDAGSDPASTGSSATGMDLSLDTDRVWYGSTDVYYGSGGNIEVTTTVYGNLIIKSAGTTLIRRPIYFVADARLGPVM
jgi:hypothetical protein